MVVKASLFGARIAEVPVTLHPDGRKSHGPHLRTFRDGWRTVRYLLLHTPRWLFLVPGFAMILLGLAGYGIAMPSLRIGGVAFDAHTLLVASLSILCGYQSILFSVFAKTFATTSKLLPPDARVERLFRVATLERGLAVGFASFLVGALLIAVALHRWWLVDFGRLDYAVTMRWVIPGVTLAAIGFQTIFASFFLNILGIGRR
jgi:hypothetical protein